MYVEMVMKGWVMARFFFLTGLELSLYDEIVSLDVKYVLEW